MRNNLQFPLSKEAADFYRRTPWPEWWVEFATTPNQYGYIKYLTVGQFIKAKVHSPEEERMLFAMIGPAVDEDVEDKAGKRGLGAIGNWERRRYRVWTAAAFIRKLFQELKQRNIFDLLRKLSSAAQVAVSRAEQLASDIDAAYGGQPYLPQLPPTAPRNRIRVRRYSRDHAMAFRLFRKAMDASIKLLFVKGVITGRIAWNGQLPTSDQDMTPFARECALQHYREWNDLK